MGGADEEDDADEADELSSIRRSAARTTSGSLEQSNFKEDPILSSYELRSPRSLKIGRVFLNFSGFFRIAERNFDDSINCAKVAEIGISVLVFGT